MPLVIAHHEPLMSVAAAPPQGRPAALPFSPTARWRHSNPPRPETPLRRVSFAHAQSSFFLSDTRAKETRWATSSSTGVTPENSARDPDPGQSCPKTCELSMLVSKRVGFTVFVNPDTGEFITYRPPRGSCAVANMAAEDARALQPRERFAVSENGKRLES